MHKLQLALLAIVAALSLAGCASTPQPAAPADDSWPAPEWQPEKQKYARWYLP
jgi:outer membrane biogenesis lipoprotein LolB